MRSIESALAWTGIVLLLIVWLPMLAVVRLFDWRAPHYATGRLFRRVGWAITKVNPAWKVTVTGELPADPRLPYVVVANHQSNADIPLVSTLPWEMKWVAKKELFQIPVAGWMLRMAGDIAVDRKDPDSRASVMRRARAVLAQRCSVMFFAEGTRSRDGRVRAFRDGAFRLAIDAGAPVLPLAIDGTASALPKHGWRFGEADCRLHVLPPVPTEGLGEGDVAALRERVRSAIVAHIAMWRGVAPDAVDATADAAAPSEAGVAVENSAKSAVGG